VECKLRCVNFRSVSDPGRAVWPAFRLTEISDDWYSKTMGVIVMILGTPRSAGENFGCAWEHLVAPATRLEAPATCLGAPMTSLGPPWTSLGASRITVKQSRKNVFFGNAAGTPGNHSYYLLFNDC
jgi:hypothetical protein